MNDNIILFAYIAGAIAFTILSLTALIGIDGIREMWRKDIRTAQTTTITIFTKLTIKRHE